MKTYFLLFLMLTFAVSCDMNTETAAYTDTFTISSTASLSEIIEEIESGNDGKSDYPEGLYFFTNQTDFDTFYHELFSHKPFIPSAPTIDFGAYRVLAYVDIEHDTVDYSVEITSIVPSASDNYTVTVTFTEPDGGAFQVTTKPFHIIKIPLL